MKAVVVLPTYNEKKNISILIPKLEKAIERSKKDVDILVVDDNSPDGTSDEVKSLQKSYKNLSLLSGEKKGLGIAYLRGFDYAVSKLKADILVMMDADLSHPPEDVPKLLSGIDNGYDLVIGSRYIPGGDTPDWSVKRRIISRGGNLFARYIGGFYGISDCTSGFRAFRSRDYKKINKKRLNTKGYAFLTTLLYELKNTGARIREIPLVFYDRRYGNTKLRTKDMVEFFHNVLRMRMDQSRRLIIFAVIGAICSLANIGMLFVFVDLFHLEKKLLSPTLSFEITVLLSFLLNSIYTFKSPILENTLPKLAKFHVTAAIGFIINLTAYNLILAYAGFGALVGRYDYLLAQVCAILIGMTWNYLGNAKWTYRDAGTKK